jgi:parvulin-like peptidyl-prolyl isomerase
MTFRAKPVSKRSSRPSREQQSRRSLYMNIGFGLVVVAAVVILVIGAGATWYADAYGQVASVNGTSISRNDYRTRYKIESWRYDQAEARLRDEFNAGRLTQSERDSGISAIESQKQSLSTIVLERLVDAELQKQLAGAEGITVTDADVDARLVEEATRKEQRHLWVIEVKPEVSAGASEPTAEQVAAAKAKADAAAADLASGKAWEDVAKAASTGSSSSQGGDLGWATADTTLDPALRDALFAAAVDAPTAVIEGADGTFRIGRVSEIVPETVDTEYEQKLKDAGISMGDYRVAAAADIRRQRLDDTITAGVVDTATVQRRVSEIYVAESQGAGEEVKVRHILYSPNDTTDQAALDALAPDDPAWAKAEADAQAAYDKLKPFVGTPELATEFEALAKAESDEPGAATSGGELPYFTRDQVDRGFGDAIFAPGLKPGDLLGPVRSQFGYHVILFEDSRPDPQSRIDTAKIRADQAGGDFAAIAREVSEGAEASQGGDIGWVAKLQLDKTLEDAIFATPVGKTSDVISISGDGMYLFKVWEEQTRKPDAEQATKLESTAFQNWYTEKKGAADITRETDLPQVTG